MIDRSPPRFRFERLADHDRKAFSCGSEPIDRWFVTMAGQQVKRDLATVHLAIDNTSEAIAGFYSLCNFTVSANALPDAVGRRLPRTAIPAHLLGYLGVSLDYKGQGLGGALANVAVDAAELQTAVAASIGVVVHALDEGLVAWYEQLGFQRIPEHPLHLIMTMADVRRLRAATR